MNNTNYEKFQLALLRLQERHDDYLESFDREELLESDRESIKESCIQRFEICLDMLWKHLKKHLEEETGLVEVPNSPKPIFRMAAENRVIDDPAVWFDHNQKRIDTSHDYSMEKAAEVLEILPDFIADAIMVYETITHTKWQK